MKRLFLGLAVVLGSILSGYFYVNWRFQAAQEAVFEVPEIKLSTELATADVKLGERIATVRNGCNDCHGQNFAGRTFIDDPAMGTFIAPNLTKLQNRSDEEIARILRYGIKASGQSVVFMPSHETQTLGRSDLASLIAFLRTLPPTDSQLSTTQPGLLAKALFAAGKLPPLFPGMLTDKSDRFVVKPAEGPTAEFGKYLVDSACIGCHGNTLAGGPIPGAPPDWPSAPSLRFSGSNFWTEDAFLRAVDTGISPRSGKTMAFPMPVAALRAMSPDELKAIYLYLATQ